MSDDRSQDEQQPEQQPETEAAPATEAPAADTTTADASTDEAPADEAPVGGMAAGWYPAEDGQLRYFDGTVWTGAVSDAPDAQRKASYGEKYRRRLPIVSLAITGVYALVLLSTYAGDPLKMIGRATVGTAAVTDATKTGVIIGAAIGVVLAGFFWTLIAAIFPGKHKEKGVRSGLPLLAVALLLAAGVGALFGMQLVKAPAVEVPAVTTAAEGCRAFLDSVDELASSRATDAKAVATFVALQEAVTTTNPEMATDLEPLTSATVTSSDASSATQSIVLRCLEQGDLTQEEVQTWAEKIQSYVP